MAYKIRILPRWLILLFDLFLVGVCIILSRSLRFNFNIANTGYNIKLILCIVLSINLLMFFIFKSYAGIIRYTNIEDTSRLLVVNSIIAVSYYVIDVIVRWYQVHVGPVGPVGVKSQYIYLFPISVIIINFFITNFVLISYRLMVRYCFRFYSQLSLIGKVRKKKVVVYDASEYGVHLKKILKDMPGGDMQVVAFIDESLTISGKLLEGIPVYYSDEYSIKKLKNEGVELLIVAAKNIRRKKLSQLVDSCLANGIRVKQAPAVDDWLNVTLDAQQLQDINIEDLLDREVIKIHNESLHSELKGKKILVTGAAGSIGSELVRQLINYHPSLVMLCDKAETPLHDLLLEIEESGKTTNINIKSCIGDICDKQRMEQLFEVYNPEIVFHAAAYKHVPLMEEHPSVAVLNNVFGTKVLAELSVANNVEKFVMVSTDKAVNPTNIMGASKRIAEIFTQSYYRHLLKDIDDKDDTKQIVTKFVTTRFGNVLGSNGSVIPRFKQQLQSGGPLTVTHPDITRYFMTIPEACRLVIEAGVMGQGGEIFVFDMGEPVKIIDLAHKIIRLAGKEPNVDIKIIFTGLRPGEKLYEELLNNAESTLPTYHDKIMIAQVREYDFAHINKRIDKLVNSARQHYTLETVFLMKELVPEFVSNNVAYSKLNTSYYE